LEDNRVITGRWRASIASRAIAGNRNLSRRGDSNTERIAEAIGPKGIICSKRIICWNFSIGTVAKSLAAYIIGLLSRRSCVLVSHCHIKHAIFAKSQPPALVAAIRPGRQSYKNRGICPFSLAVLPTNDMLLGIVRVRIEGIDKTVCIE